MGVQSSTGYSVWQTAFEQTYLTDRAREGVAADMRKTNLNERSGVADFYLSGISQAAHMFGLPFDHYAETAYKVKSPSSKVLWWNLTGWDPEARGVKRDLNRVKGVGKLGFNLGIATLALPKNFLKLSEVTTLAASLKLERTATKSNNWLVYAPAIALASVLYFLWAVVLRPAFGPWTSIKAARDKLRPNIVTAQVPKVDAAGVPVLDQNQQLIRVKKNVLVPKPRSARVKAYAYITISILLTLGIWLVGAPLLYAKLLPYLPHAIGAATKGMTNYFSGMSRVGGLFAIYGDLATLAILNVMALTAAFIYSSAQSYWQGDKIKPQPRRPLPGAQPSQMGSRSQGATLQAAVSPRPAAVLNDNTTIQLDDSILADIANTDEQKTPPLPEDAVARGSAHAQSDVMSDGELTTDDDESMSKDEGEPAEQHTDDESDLNAAPTESPPISGGVRIGEISASASTLHGSRRGRTLSGTNSMPVTPVATPTLDRRAS